MKNRIICLILCLVIIFGFASFSQTGAWFSSGTAKHQYLSSGKINYLLTGELESSDEGDVLPGMELVSTALMLENYSSISSQLRINILYSYYGSDGTFIQNEKYDNADEDSVLSVTLDSNWIKDSEDGCYYYKSKNYIIPARSDEDIEAYEAGETVIHDNTAPDSVISLISSLKFDGEKTTIANSGKTVSVKILVESKQANYVTWTELGSITV